MASRVFVTPAALGLSVLLACGGSNGGPSGAASQDDGGTEGGSSSSGSSSGASSGSGSSSGSGGSSGAVGDGGSGFDAPDGSPDLSSDPANCGFVGHVCEKTCTTGFCDPVVTRLVTGDYWVVDGDSLYYTNGKSLYAGSVTSTASDALIATLPSVPESANVSTLFTSKSYVYFQTSTGGVTVDKSTHKVATFKFASGGDAFGTIVGNDGGVYWFDGNGLLWSVPMTGGTPKQDDTWTISAIAADESGVYFYGGPQSQDTTGVWMLSGSSSTQLADGVAQTWYLQPGAKNVYGVAPSGSGTPDCQTPSTIWSVPKTGSMGGAGNVTSLFSPADYTTPFAADDVSIVWAPCAGTGAVLELPSKGGSPHPLVASWDGGAQPQLDGKYVYYTQADGSSLTTGQLTRVTR